MVNSTSDKNEEYIYMSIDHLKKGKYMLHILQKNKVVKVIEIKKK